jgi:ATP-dependent Clp protease adapter protein ClpS
VAGLTASLPETVNQPDTGQEGRGGWIVTVFDNDFNTQSEVINILMVATGCDLEEAEMETWEVHNLGKSVVHHGDQPECEQAASVIAQIGIEVRVSQE